MTPKRKKRIEKESENMYRSVKTLNEKDIFVTKADKGNAVVVLDRNNYDTNVQSIIDEGP